MTSVHRPPPPLPLLPLLPLPLQANAQADAKVEARRALRNAGLGHEDPTSVASGTSSGLLRGADPHASCAAGTGAGAGAGTGAGAGAEEDEDEDDAPSKDFAICALDVISALCEGLEGSFSSLAEPSRDLLLQLTFACLDDDLPELRQSAFALTGDMCKSCVAFLVPAALPRLMDHVLKNVREGEPGQWHPMVCNNAAWTVGELAIKVGESARLEERFVFSP